MFICSNVGEKNNVDPQKVVNIISYYEKSCDYPKNPNSTPAATAEPITPATFGPIACINR